MHNSIPPPADIRSHIVSAQDELAAAVDASISLRCAIARLEARRLTAIHEAVELAVRQARAFVSQRATPASARDLARRAVIAELALAWRVSERTMQRLANEAFTICAALPMTLNALREGRLDAAHARVIADAVGGADLDADTIAAADATLAAEAASMTPSKLRHRARVLLEQLQVETIGERHERAFEGRGVQLEPASDGMAWLTLELRAADALLIRDRLQQAARAAKAGKAGESEARTCAQLEADLARDLLLYGVPAEATAEADECDGQPGQRGDELAAARARRAVARRLLGSIRPTVHVTVPVMTLLGRSDAPGHLEGYGPIDPDAARRLAAHAPSFTRLLTHPVSGAVLDVDRGSYRAPADLRRWLQVRDGTCRFPGCSRRAATCELDHCRDWAAERGPTAHDNLAHLCSAHHHLKHETAWSVEHLDDGVLEWTSLTGAVYRTTPAGDLRANVPSLTGHPAAYPDRRAGARRPAYPDEPAF